MNTFSIELVLRAVRTRELYYYSFDAFFTSAIFDLELAHARGSCFIQINAPMGVRKRVGQEIKKAAHVAYPSAAQIASRVIRKLPAFVNVRVLRV